MKDPVYALAEAEVDMLSRISKHSDHGQDIRLDGEPQHNLVIIVTIMTGTSTKASSPPQPTSSPIRRLILILIAHFNLFAISFKLFQFKLLVYLLQYYLLLFPQKFQ